MTTRYELQPIHYSDPVDLEVLTRRLKLRVTSPLPGYESGRAQIQDAVMRELSCARARASAMVALLEELGFIRFRRSLQDLGPNPTGWELVPCPPRATRS